MAEKEKTISVHQALNDLGFKHMWSMSVKLQSGSWCFQVSSNFKKQPSFKKIISASS